MKNPDRRRARFLRDELPIRLGGVATNFARVASSARRDTGGAVVEEMLEESQWFIEWTAADAEPEIAAELVDIQRMIALWRKAWPEAQKHRTQRILLSVQAKKWSDQVLAYSGLLEQ
jgi:hypothetical protein